MMRLAAITLLLAIVLAAACAQVAGAQAPTEQEPERTLGAPPDVRDFALRIEHMLCKERQFHRARALCEYEYRAADDEHRAFFLRQIAETYSEQGDFDRAIELHQRVIDLYPTTNQVSWSRYGIAEQYFYKAKLREGVQGMVPIYLPLAEAFIRDYPDHYHVASALYARGWGLDQLNRPDEALAEYQKAVDTYPHYPHTDLCLMRVVNIHLRLKRWDETIAAARRYMALYPQRGHWEAQLALSLAYMRKGDLRQAIAEFDNIVANYPHAVDEWGAAVFYQAMCHKDLGERAAARAGLERLLERHPDHRLAERAREELRVMAGD